MKKLRKLKLRSYQEMNDSQMKSIVGGQYSGGGTSCANSVNSTPPCSGVCGPKVVNGYLKPQKCKKFESYVPGLGKRDFCDCVES